MPYFIIYRQWNREVDTLFVHKSDYISYFPNWKSIHFRHLGNLCFIPPSPSLIILHDLLRTLCRTCIREVTYRLAELPGGVDDAVI